jgi:hypothetical protein
MKGWTNFRRCAATVALNGPGKAGAERLLRAQIAGVEELHDGPQFREAVFDRRAGEGDAIAGRQAPDGLGLLGAGVLDLLRLVQYDPGPLDFLQRLLVPAGQRVGADDDVGLLGLGGELLPAGPAAAVVH